MLSSLVLLLACAPRPDETARDGRDSDEDTATMVYSVDDPPPYYTVAQIGALLEAVFALGVPNPDDIAETYGQLMSLGGGRCPGDDTDLYQPEGGCTTEEDTLYSGVGWYDVMETMVGGDGEQVELTYTHGGDFEIIDASGARFAGGGEIVVISHGEGDILFSDIDLAGTWVDTTRQDWLGVTMSSVYLATSRASPDGAALTITGGVGLGSTHLFLDNVTWDPEDACAGTMSGAIHVRDPRGYWSVWDVGDDCDLCGEVTFHNDQTLGELCLDTSAWGAAWQMLSAPH